jgi:hypothetical protein
MYRVLSRILTRGHMSRELVARHAIYVSRVCLYRLRHSRVAGLVASRRPPNVDRGDFRVP